MPIRIIRDDITRIRADAIVNAANPSLLGGGGVDGAIHQAAGPELLAECRTLGGCRTGEAKITRGYRLPAEYVIHTVGPIWHGGGQGEEQLLRSCYRNSLRLASEYKLRSVAFPLISAGTYGYPPAQALTVAMDTIGTYLATSGDMDISIVLFGHTEFLAGKQLYQDIQAYIDDVYAEAHRDAAVEKRRQQLWQQDEDAALLFDASLPDSSAQSGYSAAHELPAAAPRPKAKASLRPARRLENVPDDLAELLRRRDQGFSATLLQLIDERHMTDAECYKRANVDRKLFSKIRNNPDYRPTKPTVAAFIIALRLPLWEAESLLRKAGYALSHSSKFDLILEYCIRHGIYDIIEINEVLFQFDQPLLGAGMG